jgi:hypothetical protein
VKFSVKPGRPVRGVAKNDDISRSEPAITGSSAAIQ